MQSSDDSIGSTQTLTNATLNERDDVSPKNNTSASEPSGSPPSNYSMSLPATPKDTPIPNRKGYNSNNITLRNSESKSMNEHDKRTDVYPVREEDAEDKDSFCALKQKSRLTSVSNMTLTNVRVSITQMMVERNKSNNNLLHRDVILQL